MNSGFPGNSGLGIGGGWGPRRRRPSTPAGVLVSAVLFVVVLVIIIAMFHHSQSQGGSGDSGGACVGGPATGAGRHPSRPRQLPIPLCRRRLHNRAPRQLTALRRQRPQTEPGTGIRSAPESGSPTPVRTPAPRSRKPTGGPAGQQPEALFASGLRGLVNGRKLPAGEAERALELLAKMNVKRYGHSALLPRVWQLRHNDLGVSRSPPLRHKLGPLHPRVNASQDAIADDRNRRVSSSRQCCGKIPHLVSWARCLRQYAGEPL